MLSLSHDMASPCPAASNRTRKKRASADARFSKDANVSTERTAVLDMMRARARGRSLDNPQRFALRR